MTPSGAAASTDGEPQPVIDPHASKISPDDPRLRLATPRGRTLKRGPVLAVAGALAGALAIAVIIGLQPPKKRAGQKSDAADATTVGRAPIPDVVRNLPDNSAPVGAAKGTVPSLGRAPVPPASRLPDDAEPGSSRLAYARDPEAQKAADEFWRARRAPIAFETGDSPSDAREPRSERRGQFSDGGVQPMNGAAAAVPGVADAGDDPNYQGRKNAFAAGAGAKTTNPYLEEEVLEPRSPYQVQAGTVIPTTLLTGINSDLPGVIIGQVREAVFDTVTGEHLLIPQGSKLIASYDSMVAWGQERVLLCWNRLIRPDGSSLTLRCMPGADLAGYSGLADDVDNHWWRIIKGAALSSLLAATTQVVAGDVTGYNPTVPQVWARGAAQDMNSAGQQITRKNLNIQPTITVRPGFSVNVIVNKDMVIPPFKG